MHRVTVRCPSGPVQGYISNGVQHFLGIPYAVPPVGQLRWKVKFRTLFGQLESKKSFRKGTRVDSWMAKCFVGHGVWYSLYATCLTTISSDQHGRRLLVIIPLLPTDFCDLLLCIQKALEYLRSAEHSPFLAFACEGMDSWRRLHLCVPFCCEDHIVLITHFNSGILE